MKHFWNSMLFALLSVVLPILMIAQSSGNMCDVSFLPGMSASQTIQYNGQAMPKLSQVTGTRLILVAAHIVRSSSGTGGISTSDINMAISQLNAAYISVSIQFQLNQTDYINNDTYTELTVAEWGALSSINRISGR